jgi:hypothetical protein
MPNLRFDPFARLRGEEGPRYKRGEELFTLILSGIKEVYGVSAVIAGGAVRDFVSGTPLMKDVDVFLPIKPRTFMNRSAELGWQDLPRLLPSPKDYNGENRVVPLLGRGFSMVQGIPVDLVFMAKPLSKEEVSLFPVYAQRGVYTLDNGLDLSPEAKEDISEKKFTIDPTITDKERLKKIIEKVSGWQRRPEYKDWKIIEPDIKEWWEAKDELKQKKNNPKKSVWEQYWEDLDAPHPRILARRWNELVPVQINNAAHGRVIRVDIEGNNLDAPEEPE